MYCISVDSNYGILKCTAASYVIQNVMLSLSKVSEWLVSQQDPCYTDVGSVCGENAACSVKNHEPVCSCPRGYEGDARVSCYPKRGGYVPGRGHRN